MVMTPPPGPPGAPGQPPGGLPPPPPSYPPSAPGGYPPSHTPQSPYGGGAPQWGGPAMPIIRAGPAPGLAYAGFWIRFASYLIDVIPIWIIVGIIDQSSGNGFTCVNNGNGGVTCSGFGSLGSWLTALVLGVYWVLTWNLMGASLGQKALGMRVVNAADGQRIDIGKAVLRYVGFVISAIPFALGLIWAGFDARKQGWHDKIASTFVVRQY